jgi:hypothetical protein
MFELIHKFIIALSNSRLANTWPDEKFIANEPFEFIDCVCDNETGDTLAAFTNEILIKLPFNISLQTRSKLSVLIERHGRNRNLNIHVTLNKHQIHKWSKFESKEFAPATRTFVIISIINHLLFENEEDEIVIGIDSPINVSDIITAFNVHYNLNCTLATNPLNYFSDDTSAAED